MHNMTIYKRGDVVLVKFVFSDETGSKKRPGLVISSDSYNDHRGELIIAAVTSNVKRARVGDYKVKNYRSAGLLAPSLVTGVIRTIRRTMVERILGNISADDQVEIDANIRGYLGI